MLEFVDSGLYFVQDKTNFISPLLQAESVEESTGSGWPKITGSDWILATASQSTVHAKIIRLNNNKEKAGRIPRSSPSPGGRCLH